MNSGASSVIGENCGKPEQPSGVLGSLLGQDRQALVLRLTLLFLILHGSTNVYLDVPLRLLCGIMLMAPGQHANRVLWSLVCVCVWWVNATGWLYIDNHKFLISYWCLACTLAVYRGDPSADRIIAHNARWLIALTFLFAVLWKVIGHQYWNGEFFHYTLLTDPRLGFLAEIAGGVSPESLDQAASLESILKDHPHLELSVSLPGCSDQLRFVSAILAWWTIAIEAAVAMVFLLGSRFRWLMKSRDWLLLLFITSTYIMVPVLGFGYILAIMGLAQCPLSHRRTRSAYLLVFALLQLARLPWTDLLA